MHAILGYFVSSPFIFAFYVRMFKVSLFFQHERQNTRETVANKCEGWKCFFFSIRVKFSLDYKTVHVFALVLRTRAAFKRKVCSECGIRG